MTTVAVAGSTFTFEIPGLYSQADTRLFQTAPTIAAGDFKRSINGAALTNLDNMPAVTPAGGAQVQVILSVAETTAAAAGGRINILWRDAVGAQWCDGGCIVFVHAAEPSVANIAAGVWNRLSALLTTAGSIGKLLLEKLNLITAAAVNVTHIGPVIEGGNVVTYRGDSYKNADGRALEWESADFPVLTGATIAVIIDGAASFSGSVVSATKCRLELTAAQSGSIDEGRHRFQIVATNAGETWTIVEASWVSRTRAEV